ncbi:MAG: hypothetical protein WD824_08890 [Cyclobacteriaceae bacterium]
MKSQTTERFRKAYALLPDAVKEKTRRTYKLWQSDPYHPGLAFKQVVSDRPIYSVRMGISYRAPGIKDGTTMIWFWIGSHENYNTLINEL